MAIQTFVHEQQIGVEQPLLEIVNLHAGYGIIDVLHGVDLTVERGQVFALLGPNGAGKSTTLKTACGQIVPTSGSILMSGKEMNGTPPDVLSRAGVCLIPEGHSVFPNLTVEENLRMNTYSGTNFDEVRERAYTQFPQLKERSKQRAGTLSGGEQQMLALSRAISTDPALLMLDELSIGLAPIIVEELYEQVGQLAKSGLSILIVEQFAQSVLGVADVAAIMLHGKILKTGDPENIAEELTSAYLGIQ